MRGGRAAGDDDVPGKGGNRMARRPRKMSAPHIFDVCYRDKQAPKLVAWYLLVVVITGD